MNKKQVTSILITATAAIALIAYAAYVLVGIIPDVLITAQDRNTFATDSLFFSEQIARPFGLMQYVGAFLTQFFYYPALGAAMLIALWTASVFAGIKAFRLKGIWRALMIVPVACLLTSEVDLGYWVYILNIPGYWFSQSVAFLCTMLILCAANATPRRYRLAWYVVGGFLLFPVIGWMSYLFTACFVISQWSTEKDNARRPSWQEALGILLAVCAPIVFKALFYGKLYSDDVYHAGFPFFETTTDSTGRLVMPFYILTVATLFSALGRVLPAMKKVPAFVTYLIVGAIASVVVWSKIFRDSNYIAEMQMVQATMNDDWQGVISVAEKADRPSRTMVMLKNVALMNTGQLGTRSFELSNDGAEIYNPDSLNLSIMHIASPLIYYNHGLLNYANRWCMEFTVPFGFSPYYLKMFARTAMASGETALAQKYLTRLNGLMYYGDWKPAPVTPVVKELHSVLPDMLDNDYNNCERYIISRFSNEHHSNSPYYSELNLIYALILRNTKDYWASFSDYMATHKSAELPVAYQEAYLLFNSQSPTEFPYQVNVSPEITQRFQAFFAAGNSYAKTMTKEGTSEAMRPEFGTTYWWFNAFGRDTY